ncbi:MAG: DUF4124 domain-containing protein [Gammaproteobacteria bacterium]|nr:DUF4124 domain-containing protein [Gammaproteobacteria bacterium]
MNHIATKSVVLLLSCLALPALAATYRWVDENGVVHYSDRPRENAELVEVPTAQTYTPSARPGARAAGQSAATPAGTRGPAQEQAAYQSLRVVRPAPQETYRNIGGELAVSLSLSPALKPGHRLRVLYDGQPWPSWPERLLSYTLSGVYRGEHNIKAEVVGADGKVVASSDTVTFFVHQTSVNNRARN